MRVFLTGATGFIGGHLLYGLLERGHSVTCLIRPGSGMRARLHGAITGWSAQHSLVRVIEAEWSAPDSWLECLDGHDVAINAVGIIRQRGNSSFEAIHTTAPIALFDRAAQLDMGKIVQISAMGADEGAVSAFHRSKRTADIYLAQMGTPFVILRPSFVYGPGDHSMSFFARLASLPLTPVPGDGQYLVQPIFIGDLVRAVILAIERDDLHSVIVDAGGGRTLTFNELLDVLARRHGRSQGARKLHLPWPLMQAVAAVTDGLGGHGPITRDELLMLRQGNFADNRPFVELFGFEPTPFT